MKEPMSDKNPMLEPHDIEMDDKATDLYELAIEEGDRRFGSPCRHERTKQGYCTNCFRKVIDKL
ncbi:hypothetical protein LCGC14_1868880 [marine sediment metagenome]|uniref:Uncharacterized protein n=1 Tax=marine sediment metagenome TaxID=412755 RepID=A0A0F9G5I2_9ZZZZ